MTSGGLSTPKYGPMLIKQEPPNSDDNEEEGSEKKIVYRCPHKRDEGGRCNARATDLNLLLNHFYKHHGTERLLAKTPTKFPMCCFREDCKFYFREHSELVEHMYKHSKIAKENIYFTEYIKQIYQKEVIQARLDRPTKIVKIQKETDKELELQFSKLRLESKYLKIDYENLKDTQNKMRSETEAMKISSNLMNGQIENLKTEKNVLKEKYDSLKTENKDLKTEGFYMKTKTINLGKDIQDLEEKYKNEVQELRDDKQYYKDKYAQEKRKVANAKEYYDKNMEYEHKARYTNNNISDKKDIEIESLKRQLDKLKSNVINDVRYEMKRYKKAKFE